MVEKVPESETERKSWLTKKVQEAKFKLFYDYINYAWEKDEKYQAEFEKVKSKIETRKEEEQFRRSYYNKHINVNMEGQGLDKEEHSAFLDFARCMTDLESLDDVHNYDGKLLFNICTHTKHFFYLLQLIFLPISVQTSAVAYMGGAGCSLLARNLRSDYGGSGFFDNFIVEEETLTMVFFFFTFMVKTQLRAMVLCSIAVWSFVNICEWGCWILKNYPNFPVIGLFGTFMADVKEQRRFYVQQKVHLEFLLALTAPIALMFRLCAPLYPVIYITMFRTKAGLNSFPQRTYEKLDEMTRRCLSESTYNRWIEPNKSMLYTFGGVGMYED